MIRAALMLILLAIAFPAEANSTWSRLWLTPDQRAEKLLQQGDASAAAKEYQDPRRKAYAEMKAGDFKQAASDLGKLHDSDSDYNRGNALAKMGDLKGALDAYDAALKSDPKNHDAQHNRDLVEKAMKQQQQQNGQQNGKQNGKQQDNKSGGKQGSNSGGKGSQSGKNASGTNGKSGQQSPDQNSSQSGKSGSNPAGGNSSAQQNAQSGADKNPGSSGNRAQQNQQNNPGQPGSAAAQSQGKQAGQSGRNGQASAAQQHAASSDNSAGQTPAPAKGLSPDDAAQARQDAAASLAANKGKQGAGGNETANINAAPVDQTAPLSEQQLSKEQWLRSIPDDPGGLLRRKFMIEYMLRQQKAQQ